MARRILLTFASWLTLIGGTFAKDYPEQMQFREFQPCVGTGTMCRPQLLAYGSIDEEAPDRLSALLAASPDHPVTVAFDSPGGNLRAGLLLGMVLRGAGLNSLVADQYTEELFEDVSFETAVVPVATDVGCFSACAYAFMGGVSRKLEEGGRIGVHQFYTVDGTGREGGTQATVALVSQYMAAVGVHRDLLDVASFTEAAGMSVVSLEDARTYNLDNQSPPLQPWVLKAMDDGSLLLTTEQQKAGGDRRTTLAILTSPSQPGSLLVVIRQGNLSTPSDMGMGNRMANEETHPSICAGSSWCAPLSPLSHWKFDPDNGRLSAYFRVSTDQLLPLLQTSEQIRLDVNFPNVFYNEDPSVDLGREGLRNGLLALLR